MGIPANLSSVPAATPYVQYISAGGQTVFPYPFVITQDSDLIVVVNGVTLNTDAGYSLSGQGNSNGGNVTFTLGQTAGAIITLFRDIAIERITQFAQNSGFSSSAFNAEFNNIYLIMQQIQEALAFALTIPNTNNPVPTTVLTPASYANKYLSFDPNGNPTPAALTSLGTLTAAIIGGLIYPKSALEIAGSFNPTQLQYVYGCPRRYGADGTGASDATVAVQNAMNSNPVYNAYPGDSYSVLSVTAGQNLAEMNFNGSQFVGNATTPQNCVLQIQTNFCTFRRISIQGGSFAGVNPNSNYTCLIWWFRSGAPSQFNTIDGCQLINATRGMVYGGLPGNSATTVTHSENKLYDFQSVGVSNPLYMNSSTGFLHCYGSTFFRDASTWTTPTLPSTARAWEVIDGELYINGGEIIASNSTVGFATEGQAFISDCDIELACAMHVTGDGMRISSSTIQTNNQGVSMFVIAAASTGFMEISDSMLQRPSGVGASDRQAMIDGTLSPTFEVDLNDCNSREWSFQMAQANVKLIQGCVGRYSNHKYQQTAGATTYILGNTPRVSIIPDLTLDHLGYTTTGLILDVSFGGGSSLANTTNAGPPGYLASQLSLVATGLSTAQNGDSTSLTTIKATMQRVQPGDLFWLSSWVNMATGGTNAQLCANFYTLAGAQVGGFPTVVAADNTSIGSNAWVFVEGPITVPATAAYMAVGIAGTACTVAFTDMRCQRAK